MRLEQFVSGLDFKTYTKNYAAAQTDAVIWTPTSGKRIVLMGAFFSTDTAMNIQLESALEDIIPPTYLAANGGAVVAGGGECPLWIGAEDATLTITSSASGNHSVKVWGIEV